MREKPPGGAKKKTESHSCSELERGDGSVTGIRFPLDLVANIATELLKGRAVLTDKDVEMAANFSVRVLSACQDELEIDAASGEERRIRKAEKAAFAKELDGLKTEHPGGLSFVAFVRYVTGEGSENAAVSAYAKYLIAQDETARASADFPDFDERSSETRIATEIQGKMSASDLIDWQETLDGRRGYKLWKSEVHIHNIRREAGKSGAAKRKTKEQTSSSKKNLRNPP